MATHGWRNCIGVEKEREALPQDTEALLWGYFILFSTTSVVFTLSARAPSLGCPLHPSVLVSVAPSGSVRPTRHAVLAG